MTSQRWNHRGKSRAGALLVLAGIFKCVLTTTVEVCNGDDTRLGCPRDAIIMITSAEYGRKEVGRCIPEADDFMGCTNDVLPLLDTWCSGRRDCTVSVPNSQLEELNQECLKILIKYIKIEYTCLKVDAVCSGSRPTHSSTGSGLISSQSADTKGCGSAQSPWIISAKPGQTVHVSIIDFSVNSRRSNVVSCPVVYGYIRERAIGINHTICGGRQRQGALYSSKTNSVEVYISPRASRGDGSFVLEYEVNGCPELSRPAHAWYKREGNEAVIGCEMNDKEWRLTCTGKTWKGEVGNCTGKAEVIVQPEKTQQVRIHSVVVMTGIAGGAVVLCVVAMVIGTVYIKKYRMRQETKHMTKTYATMERNSQAYYRPVNFDAINPSLNFDLSNQDTININPNEPWDMSRDQCTCETLPARADERQSLYNSIKST